MAEPSSVQRQIGLAFTLARALEAVGSQRGTLEPVRRESPGLPDFANACVPCSCPSGCLAKSVTIDLVGTVLHDVPVVARASRVAFDVQVPRARIFTPPLQVLADSAIPTAGGLPRVRVACIG